LRGNNSSTGSVSDDSRTVTVVVETPRGRRNKYKFDEDKGRFSISRVLPLGTAFPYDFGFIPETKADDGDPIDVLLLMDEPAFPGCEVQARLIGVIEAEQTEDGQTVRNDRLVAVAEQTSEYRDLRSLRRVDDQIINEIEAFFVNYHAVQGRQFRVLRVRGPKRASRLLQQAMAKEHA